MKSADAQAVVIIMVLVAVLAIVVRVREPASPNSILASYTEADLERLVEPGVSLSRLESIFGPPANTMTGADGAVFFDYLLPPGNTSETDVLGGFQAVFEDEKLARWKPIYRNTSISK